MKIYNIIRTHFITRTIVANSAFLKSEKKERKKERAAQEQQVDGLSFKANKRAIV